MWQWDAAGPRTLRHHACTRGWRTNRPESNLRWVCVCLVGVDVHRGQPESSELDSARRQHTAVVQFHAAADATSRRPQRVSSPRLHAVAVRQDVRSSIRGASQQLRRKFILRTNERTNMQAAKWTKRTLVSSAARQQITRPTSRAGVWAGKRAERQARRGVEPSGPAARRRLVPTRWRRLATTPATANTTRAVADNRGWRQTVAICFPRRRRRRWNRRRRRRGGAAGFASPNDRHIIARPSRPAAGYRELLQSAWPRFPRTHPWPSAGRRSVRNDFSQKRTRRPRADRRSSPHSPASAVPLPISLTVPFQAARWAWPEQGSAGARTAPPTLLACFIAPPSRYRDCSPACLPAAILVLKLTFSPDPFPCNFLSP